LWTRPAVRLRTRKGRGNRNGPAPNPVVRSNRLLGGFLGSVSSFTGSVGSAFSSSGSAISGALGSFTSGSSSAFSGVTGSGSSVGSAFGSFTGSGSGVVSSGFSSLLGRIRGGFRASRERKGANGGGSSENDLAHLMVILEQQVDQARRMPHRKPAAGDRLRRVN
jgi:hypothetical protein